jgi:hypothetical protein
MGAPLGELDRFKTTHQYRFSVEWCELEIEPEGSARSPASSRAASASPISSGAPREAQRRLRQLFVVALLIIGSEV